MRICDFRRAILPFEHQPLITDQYVQAGYGQTTGGYKEDVPFYPNQEDKQYYHIQISYLGHQTYQNKQENVARFSRLWSPNIISAIAEYAGVPEERIHKAWDIIVRYEKEKNLVKVGKDAVYLKETDEFRKFKEELMWSDVLNLIKTEFSLEAVKKKIVSPK